MKSRTLWSILAALFVAVCVVAVYRIWPLLHPVAGVEVAYDPACDLRAGPCLSQLEPDASVAFSIHPEAIPLLKDLQLQVDLKGLDADGVEVDFNGVDMNMGFNRVKLEQAGEGSYRGTAVLPVCVRDAMEWEARVLIRNESNLTSVAYRFITVRPGLPIPGLE